MAAECGKKGSGVVQVASLPNMVVGRPFPLGNGPDAFVQDCINASRKVGGVGSTTIVMAASKAS